MIDFPIVDTHLHVWDPNRLDYPWLADVPVLNRAYLIDEYQRACGDVTVEKMVFVQAEVDFSLYREEAEWVTSVARDDPRLEGIVAWAPLEEGEAADPEVALQNDPGREAVGERENVEPYAQNPSQAPNRENSFHRPTTFARLLRGPDAAMR